MRSDKKTGSLKVALLAAVTCAGLLSGCCQCQDLDLTGAVIVLPENAQKREKTAAGDIAFFFNKMAGRECRIVTEDAAPATGAKVYVGATKAATAKGIAPTGKMAQCFRVKTDGGDLYLVGASQTATDFAASWTLGRCFDCYSLDYDHISAPPHNVLKLKPIDRDFTPTVAHREIYTHIREEWLVPEKKSVRADLLRRNFRDVEPEDRTVPGSRNTKRLGGVHNMHLWLPPEKFAKDHPEYYGADKSGVHKAAKVGFTQLCHSNPEVRKLLREKLVEVVKEDMKGPKELWPNLYVFCQGDFCHGRLCWCENCRKLAEKLGGENGIVVDMANELAAVLARYRPDAVIRIEAYECTEHPGRVKPAPNVQVGYADYYDKSVDILPLEDPVNCKQLALLREWTDSGTSLSFWKYLIPHYSQPQMKGLGQPGTAIDAIIADTDLYRRLGIQNVFIEAEHRGYLQRSFAFLQYFVEAQLLFDRDQDPERLVDIYMKNVYGVAYPEMNGYLQHLRQMQKDHPITRVSDWMYRRFAHLDAPGFYEKAFAFLSAAAKKAEGDSVLRAKVAAEYADVLHAYWKFGAKTVAARQQAKKDFERESRLHLYALPWPKSIIDRYEANELEAELKKPHSQGVWIDTVNDRGPLPADRGVHGADAWAELQKLGTCAEIEPESPDNDLFATAAFDPKTGKIGVVMTRHSDDPAVKGGYSVVIMNRTGPMKGATARKLVNGKFAGEFKLVPDKSNGYVYAWMEPGSEIYVEKERPKRIVAFGDSITQGVIGIRPEENWLRLLQARLGDGFATFNAGVGGNSAREAMARYERDVLARNPDLVIIEFGGNNTGLHDPSRRVDDAEFVRHLTRFRDGLPKGCAVIAVTFPPLKEDWHRVYQGSPANYVGNAALDSQRQIVRDFARENGWPLVDLYAILKDGHERFVLKDGVHLNPEGQKAFANAVFDVLRKMGFGKTW